MLNLFPRCRSWHLYWSDSRQGPCRSWRPIDHQVGHDRKWWHCQWLCNRKEEVPTCLTTHWQRNVIQQSNIPDQINGKHKFVWSNFCFKLMPRVDFKNGFALTLCQWVTVMFNISEAFCNVKDRRRPSILMKSTPGARTLNWRKIKSVTTHLKHVTATPSLHSIFEI